MVNIGIDSILNKIEKGEKSHLMIQETTKTQTGRSWYDISTKIRKIAR